MPGQGGELQVVRGISELYTPFERIEDAAMVVEAGKLVWVGPASKLPKQHAGAPGTHLGGRGVLPGLVDAHTHLIWAGSRLKEYVARSHGVSYEQIMAEGGGILATVQATRSASEPQLLAYARLRAGAFMRGGVTALEIKSGYGLDTATELAMLRVARRFGADGPQRVTTTLLAHLPDPAVGREKYLDRFIAETIPEAARARLADALDVFCDRGAFSLEETRRLLEAGRANGLKLKAHAEQLGRSGAARLVAEFGGLSADHLEHSDEGDWRAMAAAGTVATLLPGASLILGRQLPKAAAMRPSGVKVAFASDHNPGSSPLFGVLPALQLATALGGFSVEETLIGGTAFAADAIGQPLWGRLQAGAMADYLVIDGREALLPLFGWGHPFLSEMVIGGQSVWRRS